MKKLALVLCLVLAFGSAAYAVTPTFSTTVKLTGSETWTDGKLTGISVPVTPSVSMSAAASGTGFNVKAALGTTNSPSLGKYSAALSDSKFVVNVWGNEEELSDYKTPFGKVSALKKSPKNNWRLRATYTDTVIDLDNSQSALVKAFTQKKISNTLTVGGAIEKNFADVKDGNAIVDVWAQSKVGTIDLSGETAITKKASSANTIDIADFTVKAVTDVGMGITATGQFDIRSDKSKANPYNNTNISLEKKDLALTVTGIVTNKEDGSQKYTVRAIRDTGLTYLKADFSDNVAVANKKAIIADAKMRGSNDQKWGDVFLTAKDQWLKNKTYAASAVVTNVLATKVAGDAYPALIIQLDGVYCAVKDKVWVLANANTIMDKDNASSPLNIATQGKYKEKLAPKVALDTDAGLSVSNIGASTQETNASIGTKATYTFASNMNIYAGTTESFNQKNNKSTFKNVTTIGYFIQF